MFMPESDNFALVPSGIPAWILIHACVVAGRRHGRSHVNQLKTGLRVKGQGLLVAVRFGVFVAVMLVSVIFLCWLPNVGETFVRLFGRVPTGRVTAIKLRDGSAGLEI